MPVYGSIILIIIASLILIQAVKLFISSSTKIARHAGISAYTISFLIIAIATSLPEVVVGITSAVEKNSVLSFGNAIGSNVALLTLVIALPVIFSTEKGISTRTILHSQDAYYSTFFALLPIALIVDGVLSKPDGIILLTAYAFYFVIVWRRSSPIEQILERFEETRVLKETLIFILSLALLLGASEIIVKAAQALSAGLGWGLTFVGLTITAIGTSLPEIAFTLGAAKKRIQQEVLGDIVGSVVANSTVVLGLTSIIYPIKIANGGVSFSSLLMLVLIMLVFLKFTRTKEKIDKFEAIVLLLFYFIFIAVEYYLQASGFRLVFNGR